MTAICERCLRADATVRARSVYCVLSLVFWSEAWVVGGRWCRGCFRARSAKCSALSLLFGPWSVAGLFQTVRALYWNLLRGGYQARETSWAVRRWRQDVRWTAAGRFVKSLQHLLFFVVLILQQAVITAQIAGEVDLSLHQFAIAAWLGIGAGFGLAYVLIRRARTGDFFSGGELETFILLELGGIALAVVGMPAALLFAFVGAPVPALVIVFSHLFRRTTIACECADESCLEPMRMTPAEYASIVEDPRVFAVLDGHENPRTDVVRARTKRFLIVEANDPLSSPPLPAFPRPRGCHVASSTRP